MRFKPFIVGCIALVLTMTPSTLTSRPARVALAQPPDPPARVGRLNYMSGQVSFAPGGINQWAPAVLNYPLTTGTALWTDDTARAEFHVGSSAIRMDQTTEVDILNLDDHSTQLRVPQGTIDIGLRRLAAGESFEVDTPSAAVTLVHPGHYRVAVDATGQSARVTVWSGQIDVATSRYTFAVNAGQTVIISDNGGSPYEIVPTAGLDAFGQWALARDQQETRALRVAAQYVPPTMTGSEDLTPYGTWRPVSEYGIVWFPTVQSGWAPYRYGRWVWLSPWGWTWVDDSPWGFAPFHYGRWVLIGGLWAWIPGAVTVQPVFAPALVVFVILPAGGIGWFPLAPQEVYVPPYYASRMYYRNINVTVVNINVVDVTNITHVNRHSPKAVTVVNQETFLRSGSVGKSVVTIPEPEIARAKVASSAFLQPTLPSMLGHSEQAAAHTPPLAAQQRPVVVKATPPAPVVPPAVEQQAQVRNAPVRRAAESRGVPAPVPPGGPTPHPGPTSQPPQRTAPHPPAPAPAPPRSVVRTPHPRPVQTPNCDPHSRDYDPSRCPRPAPRERH